jgi:hypothetical protein
MITEPDQEKNKIGLTLPWGSLSLGLAVIAIAALGTLAVIARKQNADSLSTIALALAILSFSAQLIITLAQSFNGAQQLTQADQVNADTKSSLAAIRATSEALLTNQRDQFAQVLHAALRSAVPAAVEDIENSETDANGKETISTFEERVGALEHRLLVRIDEALADRAQNTSSASVPSLPSSTARGNAEAYREFTTFPSEERGKQLLEILQNLTPQEAAEFGKIATQTAERLREGRIGRVLKRGEMPDTVRRLETHGFVDVRSLGTGTPRAEYAVTLTKLGREVAGLIVGRQPIPDWLQDTNNQLKTESS